MTGDGLLQGSFCRLYTASVALLRPEEPGTCHHPSGSSNQPTNAWQVEEKLGSVRTPLARVCFVKSFNFQVVVRPLLRLHPVGGHRSLLNQTDNIGNVTNDKNYGLKKQRHKRNTPSCATYVFVSPFSISCSPSTAWVLIFFQNVIKTSFSLWLLHPILRSSHRY